jgi:hypothetical protein
VGAVEIAEVSVAWWAGVLDADGNVEGYVETKWGGAGDRYNGSDQEFQDNWLRQNRGIDITVVKGGSLMSYEIKFYCRWSGDVSDAANRFQAGLLARYPTASLQQYPPQPNICEFDIDASTGGYIYVALDVDSVRVASSVSEISEAPPEIVDTKSIATLQLSGASDDALLSACWVTFEVDFSGIPSDEMEGFGVTLS